MNKRLDMKSTLFTTLLVAGLMITSCDYFETNNDSTYPNTTGKFKIINELGYDANYVIKSTETDSLVGFVANATVSEPLTIMPGFKQITFTEANAAGVPKTALSSGRVGIQADKFHYLFAVPRSATKDTVVVMDNFFGVNDTTTKVRVINASSFYSGSNTFIEPTGNALTESKFSNLSYPGFDISPINLKAGVYDVYQRKVVGGVTNTLTTNFTFEGAKGYTILIKRTNEISVLTDIW